MFLKSLEIQGFKSFPDKTKLNFTRGITAVVGPNGSGKSNIADAVRWVLGEQSAKSLRGGRMEDVIFGGTQKRKALGFAKVSITIDNQDKLLEMDADEVVISRKFYRSGESEYRVNGQNVRLKDIHEMLMDTGLGRDGYSIIGQGKIAEIVSAKSSERREIFEEAAGISKFRYRKAQAERQLEMAHENLLRLKDIVTEIEDRLGPLKIQSEKAKAFVALSNEKCELEISLFIQSLDKLKVQLREHENRIMVCQTQYGGVEADLYAIEEEMGETYDRISQVAVEVEQLRQERSRMEEEFTARESQIAVYENDIFHNNETIGRLKGDLAMSGSTEEEIEQSILGKRQQIEALSGQQENIEKRMAELEGQLDSLLERSRQHGDTIRFLNERMAEISRCQGDLKVEKMAADSAIEQLTVRQEQIVAAVADREEATQKLAKEFEEVNIFIQELDEKIASDQNALKGYQYKYGTRNVKLEEIAAQMERQRLKIQEYSQKAGLLEQHENSLEDFSYSVQTVMKMSKQGALRGIRGPVSRLIRVPPEYALAIETALGAGLQNIVVDNENAAKEAIFRLRENKAGRATFLPMTAVRGNTADVRGYRNMDGYVGLASELIGFEPAYQGVVNFLLGRIILCESLDEAVRMARDNQYRYRIVTLDGQVINAGGSMTGGSSIKTNGILSRRGEIEKLKQQAGELTVQYQETKKVYDGYAQEVAALQADCLNWESAIKQEEEDRLKADFQRQALEKALAEERHQLEVLFEEQSSSKAHLETQMQKRDSAASESEQLDGELERVRGEFAQRDLGNVDLQGQQDRLNEDISQCRMEIFSIGKDKDSLQLSIQELEGRKASQQGRSQSIENDIMALLSGIEEIKEKIVLTRESIAGGRDELEKLNTGIQRGNLLRQTLEQSTTEARKREKDLMGQKETLSKEITRLEERRDGQQAEYDGIIAKLWDEYEMTYSEALEQYIEPENITLAKARLAELKNKIRSLGTVNVDAIEEYEEVSQRHAFLTAQCADVERSRDELTRLIGELTKTMRDIFGASFKEINTHFMEIFRDLFGGGEASLELTDVQNILESGIEIHVQPPGKIIKNLSALSGGEQAFVAIAIYFAILRVRPAPFCLLDEIEAALDDVNVSKYAAYLRRMTDNTQFIAISHRRGTMEEADTLYGVTMQDEGVSKLLQLQMSEVETKLGMKSE